MPDREYSFSRLDCWRRCPKHYHYRYVQELPAVPSEPAMMGAAIHEAIASYHAALGDEGGQNSYVMKRIVQQVWAKGDDGKTLPHEALAELQQMGEQYARTHYVEPERLLASEWWFERPMAHFTWRGRVDLIERDSPTRFWLTDFTKSRYANKEAQLRTYAWAVFQEWPQVEECLLRQDIIVWESVEQAVTEWTMHRDEAGEVEAEITATVMALEEATAWPHQPGNPQCGWCGYVAQCEKDFPLAEARRADSAEEARVSGNEAARCKHLGAAHEKRVRAWVEEHGPVGNGEGRVWNLWEAPKQVWDMPTLLAWAQDNALDLSEFLSVGAKGGRDLLFHHPDAEDFLTLKPGTVFGARKVGG